MYIKKGVIIGTFVAKNRILSFLEMLKYKFGVKLDKVFVYSINTNEKEYLVTFKTFDKDKFIKKLSGSTIMHVKNGCLFSINALNRLIEIEYDFKEEKPYNEVEINWDFYKDKLIILTNGNLNINDLSKIEDKCSFFA
jgi:hypothetical protein